MQEKYEVVDGHWLWTASVDLQGYGQIGIRGQRGPARAHVAMWEIVHGPVPQGMQPAHVCGVRRCINPDHLELVPRPAAPPRGFALTGMCKAGKHKIESDDDLFIWTDGTRLCKACRREQKKRTDARRRKRP